MLYGREDLPEELVAELNKGSRRRHLGLKISEMIMDCIQKNGGSAGINQMLIHFFDATGEVYKRHSIQTYLTKEINRGTIIRDVSTQGLYRINTIED